MSKLKQLVEEKAKELYNNLDNVMNLPEPIDNFATVNLIPWLSEQIEKIVREFVKDEEVK